MTSYWTVVVRGRQSDSLKEMATERERRMVCVLRRSPHMGRWGWLM